MTAVLRLVIDVLLFYQWLILLSAAMSWLVMFNVINTRNEFVRIILQALQSITEPVLTRIRRFMPHTGALDLSPVILFFAIQLLIYLLQDFLRGSTF